VVGLIICIFFWLGTSSAVWLLSNRLRSTAPPGIIALWCFVRGAAVGCLASPSIVAGGMVAVPAPALIGILTSVFAQHRVLWDLFFISTGSLIVCSLIAFGIIYARARRVSRPS
jgi:hypothetical protein